MTHVYSPARREVYRLAEAKRKELATKRKSARRIKAALGTGVK